MFELQPLDPLVYRDKTRKSSFILIAIFASLAMLFSTLLIQSFGTSGGNNFRLNLLGVVTGLVVSILLVRYHLCHLAFMKEAVYGWHLKRNLMRITNVMHRVKALAADDHPLAMQVLRFYHLAVEQMHRLDGNDSATLEIKAEKLAHQQRMEVLNLDLEQTRFDPAWIAQLSDRQAEAS